MNLTPKNHAKSKRLLHSMLIFRLPLLSLLLTCMLTPHLHAQKWQDSKKTSSTTPATSTSKPKTVVTPNSSGATNLSTSVPAFGKRASNRFLLVFDTSSSMKRHANAVQDAVVQIMRSRASGQLFRGDTLGVWTFDSELHTGIFPLQTWSPDEELAIAERVITFLKKQRYSKSSRIDELMPSVKELVANSDIITVIIISDGEGQMRNTPFDREINNAYQQNVRDMGNDRMPVVTVLQGKGGSFYKYTVSALPWPVLIPELPIPIKDEAVASKSVTNAPKPQATAPPLILSGPKPAPAPVTPAPAVATPPPQPIVKPEAATPVTPTVSAPPPAPANVPPVAPAPAPPVEVAKPEPALAEVKPAPAPITQPAPAPAQSAKQLMATQPEQPPVAVAKGTPEPLPEKTEAPPAEVKPEPTNNPTPPAVAVATQPVDPTRPKGLLIAAITLIVLALGLVFVMIRRSRSSGPSLITKSMNLRK